MVRLRVNRIDLKESCKSGERSSFHVYTMRFSVSNLYTQESKDLAYTVREKAEAGWRADMSNSIQFSQSHREAGRR